MAPTPASPVENRLEELDQRQRIIERKLEIAAEKAEEKAKTTPAISAGAGGFIIKTADNAFVFRPRLTIQTDYRFYLDDNAPKLTNGLLIRRARPQIDATLFGVIDLRIVPDFGEGRALIYDAYATLRPWSWLQLQAGKFKPPVGLERLQSDANAVFIERSHPTSLVPNRDVGAQLQGEVEKKTFEYAIGIFNGVPDGGNGDSDNHDNKDYVARVFAHPLRPLAIDELANFGIGIGASYGKRNGTPALPNLPSFRTPGQQTFFSYLADAARPEATALARSDHYRIAPQAYYYSGSFGLAGEYVLSSQKLAKGGEQGELNVVAWQVSGSVVVTGEDATFETVTPKQPLNPESGQWGALELAARYHELKVDSTAFPQFADPARSARLVRSWGVGVNWHIAKGNRLAVNYDRTDFKGGAANGADREPENALFLRAQATF